MVPTERAPPPTARDRFHGGGRQDLQDAHCVCGPLVSTPTAAADGKRGARNSTRMRTGAHRIKSEAMFGNQMNN